MPVIRSKPTNDPEPNPKPSNNPPPTPIENNSRLKPWSALAYRDYGMLWLSGVAQMITMQMRLLVAGVLLYDETGSGAQPGLLGIVQLAVQLPAVLYGGALVDQIDRTARAPIAAIRNQSDASNPSA